MSYQLYLRSADWKSKRAAAVQRDGFKCLRCGRRPKSLRSLQVHHTGYGTDLRNVPVSELQTVCARCHEALSRLAKERQIKRCELISEFSSPLPNQFGTAEDSQLAATMWH